MQEYGLTLEDYQYLEMPQQDGENYTIHVMTQSGETEGLVFTSEDQVRTGVLPECLMSERSLIDTAVRYLQQVFFPYGIFF